MNEENLACSRGFLMFSGDIERSVNLVSVLLTFFTPCSRISIVNLEQVGLVKIRLDLGIINPLMYNIPKWSGTL